MEDTKINLKRYVRLILNKDIVIFGVEKYCSFINHSQVVDIFFFQLLFVISTIVTIGNCLATEKHVKFSPIR
jgi:hypothetical protein